MALRERIIGSAVAAVTLAVAAAPTWAHAPVRRAAAATVVKLRRVKVDGKMLTVLTNAKGFTLYYLDGSTAAKVACTGKCAAIWPPLLAPSDKVAGPAHLAGLSVAHTALGLQVLFRGHPLFTFVSDTKPGEATGQGFKKIWWVATPALKAVGAKGSSGAGSWGSGSSSKSSSSSSSGSGSSKSSSGSGW